AEEVLQQRPERVQAFLLHTSILDRLCGSLCDAVLGDSDASSEETLQYIEHANLFIIPLDNERRWYRYHHLFADLLRQRCKQSLAASTEYAQSLMSDLHTRAIQWYKDPGCDFEAFPHAGGGHDVERAERLLDGKGILLHFPGMVTAVLDWLGSLPTAVL